MGRATDAAIEQMATVSANDRATRADLRGAIDGFLVALVEDAGWPPEKMPLGELLTEVEERVVKHHAGTPQTGQPVPQQAAAVRMAIVFDMFEEMRAHAGEAQLGRAL